MKTIAITNIAHAVEAFDKHRQEGTLENMWAIEIDGNLCPVVVTDGNMVVCFWDRGICHRIDDYHCSDLHYCPLCGAWWRVDYYADVDCHRGAPCSCGGAK